MNRKEANHFLLLGAHLGTGNLGVSALAASVIKIVDQLSPKSKFSFLAPFSSPGSQSLYLVGKKITIETVDFTVHPKNGLKNSIFLALILATFYKFIPTKKLKAFVANLNPCLSAFSEADFVGQIRGGDSFSDIYGLKRLVLGMVPSFIALLMGKPHILLPQTYGPYKSKFGKLLSQIVMRNSCLIFARDLESLNIVTKLTHEISGPPPVHFCPDVAFQLDPIKPEKFYIDPSLEENRNRPLIGINVSGLLYYGGYTQNNMFNLQLDYKELAQQLTQLLLEKTSADLLFVPHTWGTGVGDVENDCEASRLIIENIPDKYRQRIYRLNDKAAFYSPSEIKYLIGLCNFFIGSRMHSCIAALSQKIPTIGIAYSKKFKGVFNSVGVGDLVVDARAVGINEATDQILSFYQQKDVYQAILDKKINFIKSNILMEFQKMFSMTQ